MGKVKNTSSPLNFPLPALDGFAGHCRWMMGVVPSRKYGSRGCTHLLDRQVRLACDCQQRSCGRLQPGQLLCCFRGEPIVVLLEEWSSGSNECHIALVFSCLVSATCLAHRSRNGRPRLCSYNLGGRHRFVLLFLFSWDPKFEVSVPSVTRDLC